MLWGGDKCLKYPDALFCSCEGLEEIGRVLPMPDGGTASFDESGGLPRKARIYHLQ